MARISYGVRGRRSSWWVSLPLWVWVLGFPLILAVMVLGPMTKGFVWLYVWPFRAAWKAATHTTHRAALPPVGHAVRGYPGQPVVMTGFMDRNGVFHPFR
jgi:hypothetical protein